jgi:hypothetical protein
MTKSRRRAEASQIAVNDRSENSQREGCVQYLYRLPSKSQHRPESVEVDASRCRRGLRYPRNDKRDARIVMLNVESGLDSRRAGLGS